MLRINRSDNSEHVEVGRCTRFHTIDPCSFSGAGRKYCSYEWVSSSFRTHKQHLLYCTVLYDEKKLALLPYCTGTGIHPINKLTIKDSATVRRCPRTSLQNGVVDCSVPIPEISRTPPRNGVVDCSVPIPKISNLLPLSLLLLSRLFFTFGLRNHRMGARQQQVVSW